MNEQHANALFEQSIALLHQGDAREALKLLEKLDQAIPSNPGILYFMGTGHSIAGNKQKAIQIYERVIRLNPQFIEAYNNLALDLAYLGEHQRAISYFDTAINIRPDFEEALLNKGCSLNELGAAKEALVCFEEILNKTPNHPAALANATISHIKLADYEKAKQLAHHALSINQLDCMAYQNLGDISLKEEQPDVALNYFNSALKINPNNLDALSGAGSAYLELGDYSTALSNFDRVLHINSDHAQTYNNLGLLHHEIRDFGKAISFYSHPIQNKKRIGNREYNKSLTYLHANNFQAGWRNYVWRWKESRIPTPYLRTRNQLWEGQSTSEPVLLWHEQGIGDQILYGTLLTHAAEPAKNLSVRLDRRLVPIFQRSLPQIRFIADDAPITEGDFKYHLPLGDLGRLFRPDVQSFEHQQVAYLQPDIAKSEKLKTLIQGDKLIVGLAWVTKGQRSKERNLPIDQIVSIIQSTSPTSFVDLQYSDTKEDRARILKNQGVEIHHIDEVDNFNDLDSLAALIKACDYIITCSNSTAHLAGALGKETFLLVPFSRGRHWYWSNIRENSRSMWYPSVQVIPQATAGDWMHSLNELGAHITNQLRATDPPKIQTQ